MKEKSDMRQILFDFKLSELSFQIEKGARKWLIH